MTILNFVRHQRKDDIFRSLNELKRMYGFKALDVKEGELVSTVWHDEQTVQRFEDFSLSVTELCRQTFDELLNFY